VIAIIEKDINYYSKFSELLPYLELENPTDEEAEASAAILNELDALDAELNEANANLVTLQAEFAANH
jgi:type II secretory pathway component PulM